MIDIIRNILLVITISMLFNSKVIAQSVEPSMGRKTIMAIPVGRLVDSTTMNKIYNEIKTPFKYGVILKADDESDLVDCPNVFRFNKVWYMIYISNSKKNGYQTFIAESDDLLHWKKLGRILSFNDSTKWDAWQAAGGIALCDFKWGGSYEPEKFNGKYWMSFIGGALKGYETDPLSIGMAWTDNPSQKKEWTRFSGNPVLTSKQEDARNFEKLTLYKSQIIHDKSKSLGSQFVMYYNAKTKSGYERIGMALSNDMLYWNRYGTEPVIVNGEEKMLGISGDPQIVKIGKVWVMFYFGAFWKQGAFDTFACSNDMVNWTKWNGKNLIESSELYDSKFAHKPWVVKWKGVIYHFYNAVGNQGRVIAVATSKNLTK